MRTILIADDLDISRKRLAMILSRKGHQVLEAQDGDEAIQVLRSGQVDLVIIDLFMPTMDGFEFTRAIRADETLAQTPVIFFSATFPADDVKSLATALGVRHVLQKSSLPAQILDAVQDATETPAPQVEMISTEIFNSVHIRLISSKLTERTRGFTLACAELLTPVDGNPSGEPTPARDGGPTVSDT